MIGRLNFNAPATCIAAVNRGLQSQCIKQKAPAYPTLPELHLHMAGETVGIVTPGTTVGIRTLITLGCYEPCRSGVHLADTLCTSHHSAVARINPARATNGTLRMTRLNYTTRYTTPMQTTHAAAPE